MPDFNFEDMRDIPSPLEVLNDAELSSDGLVSARILDPSEEGVSVVGYDYLWDRRIAFEPLESERIKIVSFALGESSCDATIALILDLSDRVEESERHQEATEALRHQLSEMHRESQRQQEEQILQHKKDIARLQIMQAAELTADAIDLIRTEVMTENPELHFPEDS